MTTAPRILLCADDFAISRGTSEVIAQLVRARSINAVSCMTAMAGWAQDSKLLLAAVKANPEVEIGLHLTLADEFPLGPMSCLDAKGRLPGPDRLLGLCLARRIRSEEFAAEIDRQFVAFRERIGRAPDFVDAHQHVHVYPVLRHLVVKAVAMFAPQAWVRVPSDRLSSIITRPFAGKAIGSSIHALGFRRLLDRHGLRGNESFAGHYDFGTGFGDLLGRFFARPSRFHLVMCHPGAADADRDSIAAARVAEAAVLSELPLRLRLSPQPARIGT